MKCGHQCQAAPELCAKAGEQDGLHPPVALAVSDEAWADWAQPKSGSPSSMINEGLGLWLVGSKRQRDKRWVRMGWGCCEG